MTRHRFFLPAVLAAGMTIPAAASASTATTAPDATSMTAETTDDTTAETTATTQPVATTAAVTTTEAPPTTPAPEIVRMPLTGVPVPTEADIPQRPAIVVKIDNAPGARPQTGFNAADIVFEEIVNHNLTRFGMVFHSQGSDPVGPIRSARLQDVDLFGAFQQPIFVWSGGNPTVSAAIASSDFHSIDGSGPGMFRSRDRRSPHNLYDATTDLWGALPDLTTPPPAQFEYRDDGVEPAGDPSRGVGLRLDSIEAEWTWSAESQLYERTMNGDEHDDAASGRVTTNNVVVLAMEYAPGISGSPDAQTIGEGEAFVFSGGHYVHGRWSRADRLEPFTLTADDGSPILLTPGRTFVELPRVGNTLPFPADTPTTTSAG